MELLIVFGGLIPVLLFMFLGGSNVDPEDNAIWASTSTKARKRRAKYVKLYLTEITLCQQLGIKKQDMYVRWYHRHGEVYVSGKLLHSTNTCNTLKHVHAMLFDRYITTGIEEDKIHRKHLAEAAGIGSATLDFLLEEDLV